MNEGFTKKQWILLVAIAGAFFLSSSLLAVANLARPEGIHAHFDWPDETMNAFFAERFADTGTFRAPLRPLQNDLLRPRSFNVFGGMLVPGSFLGLSLFYGGVIFFVGTKIALFLTPLLGALGILAFAGVVRRVFASRAALLAATLAAFHPAFWYFAAYSFLPNVPFISFLLMGTWAAFVAVEKAEEKNPDRYRFAALTGASFAAALAIRSNEALWVLLTLAIGLIVTRAYKRRALVLTAFAASVVVLLPILFFQLQTYGSPFLSGYSRFTENGAANPIEFTKAASSPHLIAFQALTLPYGFHPRVVWYNLRRSWFEVALWASIPIVLGALWALFSRRASSNARRLALVVAPAAALLVASYGSWMIADPLVLRLNTIGISHVRYWIPLVFFGTPFLGLALERLWSRARRTKAGVLVCLAAYIGLSAWLVFWKAPESLLHVAGRIRLYNQAAATIVSLTEENAIIITDRTDKEVFPDRAVVAFDIDPTELNNVKTDQLLCAEQIPFYLYIGARSDLDRDGPPDDFSIPIAMPRPGYTLWKLDFAPLRGDTCTRRMYENHQE